MPSAKSKAAKAATAARVAAYNATAAALDVDPPAKGPSAVGIGKLMNIPGTPDFMSSTMVGALASANTPFKPTLPSMLNLNTSPNMNRALAVGAVTVGAGQNGNPSDEENVQPIVPGVGPTSTNFGQKGEERGVDGVGYVARPLSPIAGNIDNEKGVRAYEFERQKAKRAGELAKRKAAKSAKTSGGYVGGSGAGHNHIGKVTSEGNGGDGGRKVKSKIGSNDMDVDIADMLVEKPVKKITRGIDVIDNRTEVSLSELVLRQKKPRKVKEDDFEMVSPVRPVIVLDDLEAREMDMDEPWEHIERDFEKAREDEPSYAAVLVGIEH